MPAHDSIRLNNINDIAPAWPNARKQHPEQPVPLFQSWALLLPFQHDKLLTQRDVLSSQIAEDIEFPKEPKIANIDEFKHPPILPDTNRKCNDINEYDLKRGTTTVKGRSPTLFQSPLRLGRRRSRAATVSNGPRRSRWRRLYTRQEYRSGIGTTQNLPD